jgi:rRNA maturation endonuclease Nob1
VTIPAKGDPSEFSAYARKLENRSQRGAEEVESETQIAAKSCCIGCGKELELGSKFCNECGLN